MGKFTEKIEDSGILKNEMYHSIAPSVIHLNQQLLLEKCLSCGCIGWKMEGTFSQNFSSFGSQAVGVKVEKPQ